MTSRPGEAAVCRFGAFEVETRSGELRRNGLVIKLQEQPVRLLQYLLEHSGELVTREELRQHLWPSDTYVDFDHSLNTAVMKLREALGDSKEKPLYIQTVPRRGYRFVAPVTVAPYPNGNGAGQGLLASVAANAEELPVPTARAFAGSVDERAASTSPESHPLQASAAQNSSSGQVVSVTPRKVTGSRSRAKMAALGAAVLGIITVLAFVLRPTLPAPTITGSRRITQDGQYKSSMVTDGSRLYFSSLHGFSTFLFQTSAAGGDTLPVPTSVADPFVLDVSPDRSQLLVKSYDFFSLESPLWMIPVLGGTPHRLGGIRAHDASFSPDGKEVLYASGNSLYRVNIDGEGPRKLLIANGMPYSPVWSPDASRLRFEVAPDPETAPFGASLWEAATDGGQLHKLLGTSDPTKKMCCGRWTPDGRYFVFQANDTIWTMRERPDLFHRTNSEPHQLITGPLSVSNPLPSPDSKKLYVNSAEKRGELVRYDAKAHAFTPYFLGLSATALNFSRDGKWVTYVTFPEGSLRRSKVDGSERLQLTADSQFTPAFMPRWSPDGRQIAFMGIQRGSGIFKVYIISPDTGAPRKLIAGERDDCDPNWSPDGNSILFGRYPPEEPAGVGPMELQIFNLRTHAIEKIPGSQGLWSARWSPDGRYIVAFTRNSDRIMLFDFKSRKWTELAKIAASYEEWSATGHSVNFVGTLPGGEQGLYRVTIAGHKLQQIASLKDFRRAPSIGGWAGLTPDGDPLTVRNLGTQDIYALDIDWP